MPATLTKSQYRYILIALIFYILAQLFQQYVLRLGSLAGIHDAVQKIIVSQHIHNKIRLMGVLLSIILLWGVYAVICYALGSINNLLCLAALFSFSMFTAIEVLYRSIEFFWVVQKLSYSFAAAEIDARITMMPLFLMFDDWVGAIYFPLLLSHLLGSAIICYVAWPVSGARILALAMGINSVRLILRLMEYTPYDGLNIFSGPWYFPPVLLYLILLGIGCRQCYKTNSG